LASNISYTCDICGKTALPKSAQLKREGFLITMVEQGEQISRGGHTHSIDRPADLCATCHAGFVEVMQRYLCSIAEVISDKCPGG
jgi:hypothetical protein